MIYLITGGTGSMGQRLCKHLLMHHDVEKLIIYSRDEYKQHVMSIDIQDKRVRYIPGDVRDKDALMLAFSQGVDCVIHTAAMKRIEKCEYSPFECIKTNVLGTMNVIAACREHDVKRAVFLSTDKSVQSINVYGASKAMAEKAWLAACNYKPIFTAVRYGNIVNSRGAVIPYFKDLIKSGADSLPVTHPHMTRFAMTFEQAIHLIEHGLEGLPQAVYVQKAPTFEIADLCLAFGKEWHDIGVRPGEKYHETLIHEYESGRTYENGHYYLIAPEEPYDDNLSYGKELNRLKHRMVYDSENNDWRMSVEELRELIHSI